MVFRITIKVTKAITGMAKKIIGYEKPANHINTINIKLLKTIKVGITLRFRVVFLLKCEKPPPIRPIIIHIPMNN